MKKRTLFKKAAGTIAAIAASATILGFAACSAPVSPPAPEAKPSVTLTAVPASVSAGESAILTAAAKGFDAAPVAYAWTVDGQAEAETGAVLTFARASSGSYQVKVVASAGTQRAEASATVVVEAAPEAFSKIMDWRNIAGLTDPSVMSVAVDGQRILAGTMSSGLLWSDDAGSTWSAVAAEEHKLAHNQVGAVGMAGDLAFAGTFAGLSVWDRAADAWTKVDTGAVSDVLVADGQVYVAADKGLYHGGAAANPALTRLDVPCGKAEKLWIDGGKLYVSLDSAADAAFELAVYSVLDMAAAPVQRAFEVGTPPAVGPVFARGDVVVVGANNSLRRSTDGGADFSIDISTGGGPSMALAYDGSRLLLAKYGAPLWHSDDLGATWTSSAVPGYDGFLGILAKDVAAAGGRVYIAHSKGLYVGEFK